MLDTLAGYCLRRATTRASADFAVAMAPLGLRPAPFAIMEIVATQPGIIQMAVGSVLGIQRANLVPLVNELAARGLIERRVAPKDKRAIALHVTPEGQRLLREARVRILEHEDRILSGLTVDERSQLLDLLGKVGQVGATT